MVVPKPLGRGVRTGRVRDALGAGVAAFLFGTFPFSAGLFFLATAALEAFPRPGRSGVPTRMSRLIAVATLVCVAGFFLPLIYEDAVERQLMAVFGVASLGLWLYVVGGLRMRAHPEWTLGVAVIAVNFSAWTIALWLLTRSPAEW
jgi:hypothetical protein